MASQETTIHIEEPTEVIGNKLIYNYCLFMPVLWLLGLILPATLGILFWLIYKNQKFEEFLDPLILCWLLVGIAQALSVFINWTSSGEGIGFLIGRLLSAHVTGWFIYSFTLWLGKTYRLATDKMIRGFCILSLYIGIFSFVAVGLFFVFRGERMLYDSPISYLLNSRSQLVKSYFMVKLYYVDPTYPRVILFFPWATVLGFTCLCFLFLIPLEKNPKWKFIGMTGAFIGLIASFSRACIALFFIACCLYFWVRMNRFFRWVVLPLAAVIAVPILVFDIPILAPIEEAYNSIRDMRAGSSSAREMGYELSWEGFLESPILGKGWPGGYVHENIPMPIGTHSTFYGVLYTGGILTFGSYALAIVITIIYTYLKALKGNVVSITSFLIVACLGIFSYAEGVYIMALPLFYLMFWIGGTYRRGDYLNPEEDL